MNYWLLALIVVVLAAVLFTFQSCGKVTNAYTGEYNRKKITVNSVEKRGFSTNTISYTVKLGKLPAITIDALSIDIWGVPYSDDVYGNAPHVYIDTTAVYRLEKRYEGDTIRSTMLYFSPKKFMKPEFEEYVDFFRNKWNQVESSINKEYVYLSNHIVGLVYGTPQTFTRTFSLQKEKSKLYFAITPDGAIEYMEEDGRTTSFIGSSLSAKIQMPGKLIFIDNVHSFSIEELRKYKDEQGKTMESYFTVQYKIK